MLARIRANPQPFLLIAVGIAFLVAFVFIVSPLFNTAGMPVAELDGTLPTAAVIGRQLEVDLEYDNTGGSAVKQACVEAAISGPLHADSVLFEDVDRAPFTNGRACGGSLSGGASISLRVFFTPTGTGNAILTLTPTNGDQVVGSAYSGTIAIAPR